MSFHSRTRAQCLLVVLAIVAIQLAAANLASAATKIPADAKRLSASRLFQSRVGARTYVCGNLPPWSPGRLVSGSFYPTAKEIASLKRKAKTLKAGRELTAVRAKINSLNSYQAAAKNICKNGPPGGGSSPTPTPRPTATPSNSLFDSSGNLTAAGKVAFSVPSNLSGSVNRGISAWSTNCNGCHHMNPSGLRTNLFPLMKARIQQSPMSFSVPGEITEQQIADIVAYANF